MAGTQSEEGDDPFVAEFGAMILGDPVLDPEPASSQTNLTPASPEITTSNDPAPIVALPVELKLEIFSYLRKSRVMVIILRKTHRSFREILPKWSFKDHEHYFLHQFAMKSSEVLRNQLEFAERFSKAKRIKLFPLRHYPCYWCNKVLPAGRFTDRSTRGPKSIAGERSWRRWCIQCSTKRNIKGNYDPTGSLSPDHAFKINGIWHGIYQCWTLVPYENRHDVDWRSREPLRDLICLGCHKKFDGLMFYSHYDQYPAVVQYLSIKKVVPLRGKAWLVTVHNRKNREATNDFVFPSDRDLNPLWGDPDDPWYTEISDYVRSIL